MRLNLEQHCFRVEIGRRTMHFSNAQVGRAMTFDEVRETEDDPPEKHWPERWKRRLDL